MFKIDEEVESAIRSVIQYGGNWHSGNRHVISLGDTSFTVSYLGNEVFGYDKSDKSFWINDCGWVTRTTNNLINSCFRGADIPYAVFTSKGRFCIRSIHTGLERVIGDGIVRSSDIEEQAYWKNRV